MSQFSIYHCTVYSVLVLYSKVYGVLILYSTVLYPCRVVVINVPLYSLQCTGTIQYSVLALYSTVYSVRVLYSTVLSPCSVVVINVPLYSFFQCSLQRYKLNHATSMLICYFAQTKENCPLRQGEEGWGGGQVITIIAL